MKKMGEMLLRNESFEEIVMGNTAVVRAMIEAGTRVITSYPGSPTPEIASAMSTIPEESRPFYFEFSVNEKVATEVAFGASVNGHLSTVFFKSVGLNVAADSLIQLSLLNLTGGLVIILGDDPGANSSQNEQDNRHFAKMSYMPVLEPSNPEEVYQYYKKAADLSRKMGYPVILRLTTHVCHAKSRVSFNSWTPEKWDKTPKFDSRNGPYIPITSKVFPMKRRALNMLKDFAVNAELLDLNRKIKGSDHSRGIITAGLPCLSLQDALVDVSEENHPDILKLGVVHPLNVHSISEFLSSHDEIYILEELDDILETDIKRIAYENNISSKIHGKKDIESYIGEYTSDRVKALLHGIWPDIIPAETKDPDKDSTPAVPIRPAQLCPGCGHRSALYSIKKAINDNDITVADIGCHSLSFLPPYEIGEALLCMGASTGIASGLSIGNDSRRILCLLGDSTFFHAGIPGIINTIFNKHNITLVIMENGTTAMTGHQDHAASGRNFNAEVDRIPIRKVLEGLGVKNIFEVDTYQQSKLTDMITEAMDSSEFSVVIAKHPCMLKLMRQNRKKEGFKSRRVDIDQQSCDHIHECVSSFACPTFQMSEDGSVTVNPDLCIGDGSCIQTCPTKAIQSAGKGE